jgi:FixJ family two-component response regulator
MPGMDGMEVLRRIRASWPTIPVAIVTGHGTIDLAVEAMKLGAIDFIQKPFSPAEILEVARAVVPRNDRNEGSDDT